MLLQKKNNLFRKARKQETRKRSKIKQNGSEGQANNNTISTDQKVEDQE